MFNLSFTFYAFMLDSPFFIFALFCSVVLPGSQEHLSHSLHLTSVHLLKSTEIGREGVKREKDNKREKGIIGNKNVGNTVEERERERVKKKRAKSKEKKEKSIKREKDQ